MEKISGARYIAETLNRYGVTHVFFMEAILRRTLVEMEKLGIKRILTHSEKAAAYMADGFARAANKPGVCMAQSVGAANLAAGLQDAKLGHSPVVALTGRKPAIYRYRNAYQEIDHNRMYEPVTKYNVELETLEQLPYLLAQVLREATTGSPGPVHLDFLGNEGNLTDEAEGELIPLDEQTYTRVPSLRISPSAEDIARAAVLLKKAKQPVIVAGRGAVVSGAGAAIRKLAESCGIPVASSMDGKGLLPDNHPLCVGPAGTYCRPCANNVVGMADAVLFIGTGTGDQVTRNWKLPRVGTPVVQIDINPSELGRNYPNTAGILADAKLGVEKLAEAMAGVVYDAAWTAIAKAQVEAFMKKVEPFCTSDEIPIRAERLCREITKVLPDNAVVVADTGYSAIWAGTLIDITSPNQLFLRAAGSLGWAFPASLGVKCALPDKPVICFSGDGAFWYHLCELETAARWNIPTVTVINNNNILGQCLPGIRMAYRDEKGCEEQLYRFKDTNFAQLAKDLGCYGVRVEEPKDIGPAIQKALARGKPSVVEVMTQPESHPILEMK